MKASTFVCAAVVGLGAVIAGIGGCSSTKAKVPGTAGATGSAGVGGSGGLGGTSPGPQGDAGTGTSAGAGTTGAAGTGSAIAGAAGTASAADGGDASTDAPDASDASSTGDAGGAISRDVTKIAPTTGCGKDPGQTAGVTLRATIQTSGTKDPTCADRKCGAWSYVREYFITLPMGYVDTKAYPLVFEGTGCGGTGANVYPLGGTNTANAGNTVIRVGLTPPPNDIGHATNPNQGCFDDKEGDDSVDFVFYETLWDQLAQQVCFDQNRVFAAGNSSGAWLADELGCKYAGDAKHPIRGVLVNGGGLPTSVSMAPTCSGRPAAHMWIHEPPVTIDAIDTGRIAIRRAFLVNGCDATGGSFETATFTPFPIGGGNADTLCKEVVGCPALYPVVDCPLASSTHTTDDSVVNPGFSTFLQLFSKPPLLAP